jgi:glycosyl transferase, family 25
MADQVGAKIINLAHRMDRREECRREMAALGWHEGDDSFFTARHLPDAPARGCLLSHGKAIADFLFLEEKPLATQRTCYSDIEKKMVDYGV